MKRVGPILIVILTVLVIMIVRNCDAIAPRTGPTSTAPAPRQVKIIIDWVHAARIHRDHPLTPYDRDLDFPHWRDADKYGWTGEPNHSCDTREAALVRDGRHVQVDPTTCTVTAGAWTDPYTGKVITSPAELDIDHIVPLEQAYLTGADKWSKEKRTRYANNPGVLLTVSASANRSKGDQSPAQWQPINRTDWCDYGTRWATVKHRWQLSYESQAEKAATVRLLDTCRRH